MLGRDTTDEDIDPTVDQVPTSTPTPTATLTPQPTSSDTALVAAAPILLSAPSPAEDNVLGAQVISKNALVKKQKEKLPLVNSLIVFVGVMVLAYFKLKK